jgi:EmrB/QacA subfamily drug resistance transporter
MERRWQILLVTSVAVFMSFLDVTIVNIAFPDIRSSFPEASLAGLSWVLNAYTIVYAAALVPAGRLADRIGRRRSFLIGTIAFLGASALAGAAGSIDILIGARVVQALGAAIVVPTSLSLLLPEFPLEKRATATALWGATGAVAAAIGPSLGGVLVDWQGWRWVFFVNLLIGLPALVPARRILRESRDSAATLPDALGVVLLTLAMGALSLGIVEGPDWGWGSPGVLVAFGISGLLLPLFIVRSARHRAPVIALSLFRVRSFTVANAGMFVFSLGFYALLLCNVLFLTGVWDYSILRAGVSLTPGPLMAAIAAVIGGRLSDRFGQRVVAVPGGLLFALGTTSFYVNVGVEPHYASEFLPATILTGAGVGLSFAAFGSAAVAELPRSRYATGSAVSAAFRQIGAVLGISGLIAVIGTASQSDVMDVYQRAWIFMVATGALAGVIAIGLGRVRARHVDEYGERQVDQSDVSPGEFAPAAPVADTTG